MPEKTGAGPALGCRVQRRDVFPESSTITDSKRLAPVAQIGRAGADSLVALLFPDSCRICQRPVESFSTVPICEDCFGSIRPYEGLECDRCGLFLQGSAPLHGTSLCGLCRRGTFSFEQARSFASYEGALRDLIQRFKYDGFRPLARPLGKCLAEAVGRLGEDGWDLVVPVPLHSRRQRERGFNQAELLAARLSRLCGIPLGTKDCVRVRETRPQTGLRAAERRKNVAGAFHVPNPRRIRSRRVLLVDDVLTTGATADACARALLLAGAKAVWVATLARAHPTGPPDR